MIQIYEALFDTVFRLGGKYGPLVVLGVLAVVGCGVALRILSWILARSGSRDG